jgi:hypothetical protein
MEWRQRIVFGKIWVCVSHEASINHADFWFLVALQQIVNETNKIERLLFSLYTLLLRVRDRSLVGDQLLKHIRRWLSPPDPSTNHNIACKVRHRGTTVWFFESAVLAEWKARGSLLWIHGKRRSLRPGARALH